MPPIEHLALYFFASIGMIVVFLFFVLITWGFYLSRKVEKAAEEERKSVEAALDPQRRQEKVDALIREAEELKGGNDGEK